MANPKGFDDLTMEKHHPARQDGATELIPKTIHDYIHQGEIEAVRDIFNQDNISGNPNAWTAKIKK